MVGDFAALALELLYAFLDVGVLVGVVDARLDARLLCPRVWREQYCRQEEGGGDGDSL